jgi:hypothetical protein
VILFFTPERFDPLIPKGAWIRIGLRSVIKIVRNKLFSFLLSHKQISAMTINEYIYFSNDGVLHMRSEAKTGKEVEAAILVAGIIPMSEIMRMKWKIRMVAFVAAILSKIANPEHFLPYIIIIALLL